MYFSNIRNTSDKKNAQNYLKQALNFFNSEHYAEAEDYYKLAGDLVKAKWAHACHLQVQGEGKLMSGKPNLVKEGQALFLRAANILEEIGLREKAASSFVRGGDYAQAARLFADIDMPVRAAKCQWLGKSAREAATTLFKAGPASIVLAIETARAAGHLDLLLAFTETLPPEQFAFKDFMFAKTARDLLRQKNEAEFKRFTAMISSVAERRRLYEVTLTHFA
jgi:hypothetical protein